jgi:putative tryptophan/tyrosine transport system substrate-binding protein
MELRWAEGQRDRLPALAADLVRCRVTVTDTVSDPAAALAAKAATATIPIVFTCGADPVRVGLVDSLDRPAGNVTGVTYFVTKLGPERLEWLRQLIPQAGVIAVLVNPSNSTTELAIRDMRAAALSVRQQMIVLSATTPAEIDEAFAAMAKQKVGGVIVNGDRFLCGQSNQVIALAALYRIPSIYFTRRLSKPAA